MTDDVSWFWAGEHGRDEILRDSVDSLHSQLSHSSRQSTRLSSQLAELKGSMEARLSALSIAFDAYVELGDIREQLAGYPDTSQLRREVREALTALTEGRTATPLDSRDLPYWLPYATNAVLAIAAGSPDPAAEDTARSLSPDSELFIVAAAGAVGHGRAVRDRLPQLLVTDGTLSPTQQTLWQAALAGTYGDAVGILADIEPLWRASIAAEEPRGWLGWVQQHGGSGPLASMEWIRDLYDPTRVAPASSGGGPSSGLRSVVSDLAGSGLGDEVGLLRRARELRARIENPTASPVESTSAEAGEPSDRVPVVDAVRSALTDDGLATPARTVVLGWLSPVLSATLDTLEQQAAQPPDFTESVSSAAGAVPVTPSGTDNAVLEQRSAEIRAANRPSAIGLYLFAGISAATLVVALALILVGSAASAFLFFFLAGVGCLGVLYQLRQRRSAARHAEQEVNRLRERIDEAHASARAREQRWRRELEATRQLAGGLRQRIGTIGVLSGSADLR